MTNSTTVRTPEEYPWGYSLSWRHELAIASLGGNLPMRDEWLSRQVQYLQTQMNDKKLAFGRMRGYQRSLHHANAIFTAVIPSLITARYKLEALLLCPELRVVDIATAMSLPDEAVMAYERIFYNVRDNGGVVLRSPWLNEFFSLPRVQGGRASENVETMWKRIAFENGHKMLFSIWGWKMPGADSIGLPESDFYASMFRELFNTLYTTICFGRLDSKAVVELVRELGIRFDAMRDRGILSDEDESSDDSVLGKMLQLMAPNMTELSDERVNAMQHELEDKIGSIRKTEVSSSGDTMAKISLQLKQVKGQIP